MTQRNATIVKYAAGGGSLVMVILAFTVQWGVVTAKLDQVERRLDELILEARAMRREYVSLEKRLSFLEGQRSGVTP